MIGVLFAGLAAFAPCVAPPVEAPVIDPYRAPACEYCAGNRGIDFGPTSGMTVRAVVPGRVSFAGRVAGTGYVVLDVGDGIRHTYGGMASIAVRTGDTVGLRARLGSASRTLHFGVRSGDDYLDPTPMFGVYRRRARLIPIDGRRGGPAPAARLVCPSERGLRARR